MEKDKIMYSSRYADDDGTYEYRCVVLPSSLHCRLSFKVLLTEPEWRKLGLQMSPGWEHVAYYRSTATMMFRRQRQ